MTRTPRPALPTQPRPLHPRALRGVRGGSQDAYPSNIVVNTEKAGSDDWQLAQS